LPDLTDDQRDGEPYRQPGFPGKSRSIVKQVMERVCSGKDLPDPWLMMKQWPFAARASNATQGMKPREMVKTTMRDAR